MQQLTFVGTRRLEWHEVPDPVLGTPDAALVRPVAVATCDLDAGIVSGSAPLPGPFAFGHEFVADVVAVGDAVRTTTVGQRVVVPFQINCGTLRPVHTRPDRELRSSSAHGVIRTGTALPRVRRRAQ